MDKKLSLFIKCDSCGGKIHLGDTVYQYEGYCGIYCSGECYANAYATTHTLSKNIINSCMAKVYKEEVVTETVESPLTNAEYELMGFDIRNKDE